MKCKFLTYDKDKKWLSFFYNDKEWKKKFVVNLGYDEYSYDDIELLIFSQMPHITKADILELFEFSILCCFWASRIEGDEIVIWTHRIDNLDENLSPNPPKPTYISEYINIIGQLFLAGYIDFGTYCDDEDRDKIDYPENLSYYKEDKYQAWIYFRDNFFYANAFDKSDDEDILIYEDKEYTPKNCPTYFNTETKRRKYCGYSTMYSDTSWDTPQYWSQYNIWVARTEKGTKYFNEILAPRFYNKYKDLSVEIDEKGNIVRWIGAINR
ncbi:hypothetical protein [Helicobacter hepaticus]|jgi:hypothetical protein|uniref:Uncharacterized protein n=1 Tax=Helicobacter hepaticus (strain ATCC 51449 / 3B1) TaxID=235279 RepID=Q7VJP4_HELHP|nr:hypothetical protein [Helicobacter hepaticus]AAP76796.1 hypothetical protein HH_0199 [Helicobacter hepaticus ATCC 51449]